MLSNQAPLWPVALIVLAVAGSFACPTIAQPDEDNGEAESQAPEDSAGSNEIETIRVTARRRSENIQDVPIAVSNFNSDDLDSQQLTDLADLGGAVPTLNVSFITSPSTAIIFLRGAGQDDTNPPTEQPIGIYLDGVPYTKAAGAIFDLVDLERVEVLRGPQGTLYGRNSTGGAIKLVSRRPSFEETRGTLRATLGSYNRQDVVGSLSTPLTDELAIRLDVVSRSEDGFIRDALSAGDGTRPERYNSLDRQTFRLGLHWRPTDALTVFATADTTNENNGPFSTTPAADNSVEANFQDGDFVQSPNLFGSPFLAAPSLFADSRFSSSGGMINVDYDLGTIGLEAIFGYRQFEQNNGIDTDGGPFRGGFDADFVRDWDHDNFTFELKAGSQGRGDLNWIGGVFLMRENNRALSVLGQFTDPAFPAVPPGGASGETVDQQLDSIGVFGEVSYQIHERLELTAGGRYTRDSKDITRALSPAFGFPPFFGAQFPEISGDATFEKFTPRLILDFDITDTVSAYASYSQGFQAGAFDGFTFAFSEAGAQSGITPIPETVVDSFEIGLRSTWFNDRVVANITAFDADYNDLPTTTFDTSPEGFLQVLNFDASIRGLEFDLAARPTRALSMYASFAFTSNSTPLDNPAIPPSQVPGRTENELKYVSPFSGRFGATYEHILPEGLGSLSLDANLTVQGEFFTSTTNTPFAYEDGYTLLGAQLGYQTPDEHWLFQIGGRNLTDEVYELRASNGGGGSRTFGKPGNWYLTLEYRY